nr:oocyte zinc finger protein XlCOF22-like isoform X1 [Rhipicephalus microplus]
MHRIPQGEKNKVTRQCWLDNLQRANFDPNTASRVCSVHFVDGRPTEENPYPTLHLGTLSVRHVGTPGGVRCTAQSQLDKNLQLGASRGSRRRHSVINEHFVEVKAEDSLPSRSQLGPGIITYERPFRVYKQAMVSPKCSSCGCSFKAVDKMDKGIQAQLERNRDHTYYTDSKKLRQLLSGDVIIGCTSRKSHCRRADNNGIVAEQVREAAPRLVCDFGQGVEISPEPVCKQNHVKDISVQVGLLTRHEESQANERKILSTIATQTEPQAVCSGPVSLSSQEHSSSSAPLRDRLHSCQQCSYVTLNRSTMSRHLCKDKGKHPFQCHLCPAAFICKSKLVSHMRTHTGERPFSCAYCSASFPLKSTLDGHIRTHTKERPFSCVQCRASFTLKRILVAHMQTHTADRPFSCELCDASFRQKSSFYAHMHSHTGVPPFSCVYCNASFTQKFNLVKHIRIHTGERPFSCVLCNASFTAKYYLVQHMRAHTGERPFSCVHCNASFLQKGTLQKHMRCHVGERPHSCVHCNASFSQKYHLTMHVSRHHGNKS